MSYIKESPVICEHIGWEIRGIATILFWGGGKGTIEMNPYRFFISDSKELTDEMIIAHSNDGRFGCEEIVALDVEVYKLYGNVYFEEKVINHVDFAEYKHNIEFDEKEINKFRDQGLQIGYCGI